MITPEQKKSSAIVHVQQKAFSRFLLNKQNSLSKDLTKTKLLSGDRSDLTSSRENIDYRVFNGYISDLVSTVHGIPQGQAKFEKLALQAKNRAPAACEDAPILGAAAPLLNIAKSQSHSKQTINKITGEINRFVFDKKSNEFVEEYQVEDSKAESFRLQAAARRILKTVTKQSKKAVNNSQNEVPKYRVCSCLRNLVNEGQEVGIISSKKMDSVRYSGLQTCGSVWTCKVCATRISEVRKLEIRSAVDQHLSVGGGVIFTTNTISHSKNDDLRLLLKTFFDVIWPRYINHRAFKKVRKQFGYVGRIRAVEVTWSPANGWHPHTHEIWFLEKPISTEDMELLQTALFDVWQTTCVNAGLKAPTKEYGLHVQGASSAADYIAKFGTEPKWEVGKELTKSHLKKSKNRAGKTPFDILRDYELTGSIQSAFLFTEYAAAFHGMRQLFWSRGLKDLFKIDEVSDESIAESLEDDAVLIVKIQKEDWRLVLIEDSRAFVLQIAKAGGQQAVDRFLFRLRDSYKSASAIS